VTASKNKKLLLSYVCFTGMFLITISISVLILVGLFYYPYTVLPFIVIPYYTNALFLSKCELQAAGNRWKYFSESFFIFKMLRNYLQLEFKVCSSKLKEAEKKADAKFIFAVFPHGTACDYRVLMDGMMHTVFPNIGSEKIRTLAASVLFRIPLVREMSLWTGCVDARRSVAEKIVDNGYSMLVLPGGEAEQIRTTYRKERIYLKSRKGFVKLAMRKGVPVVPTYVFGVNDYYCTSDTLFAPRMWLQKKIGICIPFAWGQWSSIFVPLPVKTTIVFGDPITFKIKEHGSPTNEELNLAHEEFCKALRHLFDSQKASLGYGDRELEIL